MTLALALGSVAPAAAQAAPQCPAVAVYYPPTTLPPGCEVDDGGTVSPGPLGPTGPIGTGLLGDDGGDRGAAGQGGDLRGAKGQGAGQGALAKTGPMDVLQVVRWASVLLGLGALARYAARQDRLT